MSSQLAVAHNKAYFIPSSWSHRMHNSCSWYMAKYVCTHVQLWWRGDAQGQCKHQAAHWWHPHCSMPSCKQCQHILGIQELIIFGQLLVWCSQTAFGQVFLCETSVDIGAVPLPWVCRPATDTSPTSSGSRATSFILLHNETTYIVYTATANQLCS